MQLRNREPSALELLLHRHGAEIHAVAFLIVRNDADAEEVTADTLLTAWRKIHTLREPLRLRSWPLTIATRTALRRQQRSREVVPLLPEMLELRTPHTDPMDRLILAEALDALPAWMRAVVALHYVADLTVDEVSAVTGRSRNTVKSQPNSLCQTITQALDEGALVSFPRLGFVSDDVPLTLVEHYQLVSPTCHEDRVAGTVQFRVEFEMFDGRPVATVVLYRHGERPRLAELWPNVDRAEIVDNGEVLARIQPDFVDTIRPLFPQNVVGDLPQPGVAGLMSLWEALLMHNEISRNVDDLFSTTTPCRVELAAHVVIVTYPAAWFTNEPTEHAPACSWFSDRPWPEMLEGPSIFVGSGGVLPSEWPTRATLTELEVAGREALRVDEWRASGSVGGSSKPFFMYWIAIDAPEPCRMTTPTGSCRRTIIARTWSEDPETGALYRAVLDRMMELIVID